MSSEINNFRARCTASICEPCHQCLKRICCGTPIGHAFCILPMSKVTCIKYVWGWLCVTSLATGLILNCAVYGNAKFNPSPTDMSIIRNKISSVFCDAFTLSSNVKFNAFLFDKEPVINENSSQIYQTVQQGFFLDKTYCSFYLLQGSKLTVDACAGNDAWLYVIGGKQNLELWTSRSTSGCEACYLVKKKLKGSPCVSSRTIPLTFQANQSNEYFILVSQESGSATWFYLDVTLDRRLYDVRYASENCLDDEAGCTFHLDVKLKQYIAFHVGYLPYKREITMRSSCHSRVEMYLILTLLLPIVIGTSLTTAVILYCKERTNDSVDDGYTILEGNLCENSVLLENDHDRNSSYFAITQPPKYEDIEHESRMPPTYEEATSQSPLATN